MQTGSNFKFLTWNNGAPHCLPRTINYLRPWCKTSSGFYWHFNFSSHHSKVLSLWCFWFFGETNSVHLHCLEAGAAAGFGVSRGKIESPKKLESMMTLLYVLCNFYWYFRNSSSIILRNFLIFLRTFSDEIVSSSGHRRLFYKYVNWFPLTLPCGRPCLQPIPKPDQTATQLNSRDISRGV